MMGSQMVGMSASVNLPLHHKVQKFSSGTGSPGWSRKKGHKTVVVWLLEIIWNQAMGVCKPAYLMPVPSQDKLGGLLLEGHLA